MNDTNPEYEQAEAVGRLLADAFIVRTHRFPVSARRHLLLACRERLAQGDPELAELLFKGE
jgi:hypothetical protein